MKKNGMKCNMRGAKKKKFLIEMRKKLFKRY